MEFAHALQQNVKQKWRIVALETTTLAQILQISLLSVHPIARLAQVVRTLQSLVQIPLQPAFNASLDLTTLALGRRLVCFARLEHIPPRILQILPPFARPAQTGHFLHLVAQTLH